MKTKLAFSVVVYCCGLLHLVSGWERPEASWSNGSAILRHLIHTFLVRLIGLADHSCLYRISIGSADYKDYGCHFFGLYFLAKNKKKLAFFVQKKQKKAKKILHFI